MSIRILYTLFIVIFILFISITLGTAQAPSNTDYFDHITLFSDGRITRFTQMPIQVYISPIIKGSSYLPELCYAMRDSDERNFSLKRLITNSSCDILSATICRKR
ncbi:MAG: hypothetical protein OXI43_02550 [Candidatus Poribacteria bacterium]|nr:hypothetical protein [Candidatus Poribacteria bacterium]